MLPPSPYDPAGLSKNVWAAPCSASSSHFDGSFMQKPLPALVPRMVTLALNGTSVVNLCFISSTALSQSKTGESLKESLTEVEVLSTLPAFEISGRPSAPVMDRLARQTLFKYI